MPTPSSTGPTPGTPGPNPTATGPAPATPPGVALVITQADSGQTVTLARGSTAELRLGNGLTWSNLSVAGGAVTIAPEALPTDAGYQGWRLTAVAPGSVVVTATGRQTCRAGELCAAFVVLFRVTINVP